MVVRGTVLVFITVLTLTATVSSWSLNNAKIVERRSYPLDSESLSLSERNVDFPAEGEENYAGYQDWLEQIDLQRRADEELEAAEIAAAEDEYERIKYNMELEEKGKMLEEKRTVGIPTENVEVPESARRSDQEEADALAKKSLEEEEELESKMDKKRGVKQKHTGQMGVSDPFCDDAKQRLAVDWDPDDPANAKDYMCNSTTLQPAHKTFTTQCVQPEEPSHYCMRDNLTKQMEPPVMGHHRPLWARYGKYKYLPWQRWLHNLEHGAVGLLYHKCADQKEVAKAENVLVNCLWKHIITPYDLPPDKPLALVSWGCYLYMTHFDEKTVLDFITDHALRGRENRVIQDGDYNKMLEKPAKTVSTLADSDICPKSKFPDMSKKKEEEEITDNSAHSNLSQAATVWQVKKLDEKQPLERRPNEEDHHKPHKRSTATHQVQSWNSLDKKKRRLERRDVEWMVNEPTSMIPELEREADIARLEREEDRTDLEREEDIAELEKEEDIARLEREADVARLERDLDTVKKLFRQKVKPLLHNQKNFQ